MKNIIILILVIIGLSYITACDSCSRHENDIETSYEEILISWKGDSIGSLFIEKSFIILPFYFEGVEDSLSVRLSIDYDGTFLFKETLLHKTESETKLDIQQDSLYNYFYLENMKGKIGGHSFADKNLVVKQYYGNEFSDIVGNIDLSFFANNVLAINFSDDNIFVFSSVEKIPDYKDLKFNDYEVYNGKIHLPVEINETEYSFKLLSESSVYALFNTYRIGDDSFSTYINNEKYENPSLFPTEQDLLTSVKTDGIIGSVFFRDKCLILDLKNKKFAMKYSK